MTVMLFRLALAAATIAPAAALPAVAPTVQQRFEAATAALVAAEWEQALAGFTALEAQLSRSKADAASLSVVRVRKGEALMRLGRNEEAARALEQGLAMLPATLAEDRSLALAALGDLAMRRRDWKEAETRFRSAQAAAPSQLVRLRAEEGLIQTLMAKLPRSALAEADRVIAGFAVSPPEPLVEARIRNLRTRALVRLRRLPEAREEALRVEALVPGGNFRPTPKGVASASVPAAVYESHGLAEGEEGDVRLSLALAPDGRVTGCRVAVPSPSPRLNALSCDFVQKRAPLNRRLVEAMAKAGAPGDLVVRWQTPTPGVDNPEEFLASRVWVDHALSDADYPFASISRREQGVVRYRIAIDENGMPTGCTVTQSSGYPSLDEVTCRLMSERFPYLPAVDAEGRRVASEVTSRTVWRLPL